MHGKFGLVIHAAFWIAQNASPPRSHSSPRQLFTTMVEEADPTHRMHGKFDVVIQLMFWIPQNWSPPMPHSSPRQEVGRLERLDVLEDELREEDRLDEREEDERDLLESSESDELVRTEDLLDSGVELAILVLELPDDGRDVDDERGVDDPDDGREDAEDAEDEGMEIPEHSTRQLKNVREHPSRSRQTLSPSQQ